MQRVQQILQASVLFRVLAALCQWFGDQWRKSGVLQWFLHPPEQRELAESEHSVFTRLWRAAHRLLCRVYKGLRLDRLLAGSVFQKCSCFK